MSDIFDDYYDSFDDLAAYNDYYAPTVDTVMLPCQVSYHDATDTVYSVKPPSIDVVEETLRHRNSRYQYTTREFPTSAEVYSPTEMEKKTDKQMFQEGWIRIWSDTFPSGTFVVYRRPR